MYLDIIILLILALFIKSGFTLGFFVQFISIFGLIGNLFLANYLTPLAIQALKIQGKLESEIPVYILIFIAIYICLLVITSILNKFFSKQEKDIFTRLGGVVISLAKGIIVCIVLLSVFGIVVKESSKLEKIAENSKAIAYSEKIIPYISLYLPEGIKIKLEEIRAGKIIDKNIDEIL
ncbi:MAG: CvpA family protein [Fusobacteriaceae bacterium]